MFDCDKKNVLTESGIKYGYPRNPRIGNRLDEPLRRMRSFPSEQRKEQAMPAPFLITTCLLRRQLVRIRIDPVGADKPRPYELGIVGQAGCRPADKVRCPSEFEIKHIGVIRIARDAHFELRRRIEKR